MNFDVIFRVGRSRRTSEMVLYWRWWRRYRRSIGRIVRHNSRQSRLVPKVSGIIFVSHVTILLHRRTPTRFYHTMRRLRLLCKDKIYYVKSINQSAESRFDREFSHYLRVRQWKMIYF